MKLSRFFKSIELDDNIVAIFNTLVMDIIYVTKNELKKIENLNVTQEEMKLLKNAGIYVKTSKVDDEALQQVQNRYNHICGNISIMYLVSRYYYLSYVSCSTSSTTAPNNVLEALYIKAFSFLL